MSMYPLTGTSYIALALYWPISVGNWVELNTLSIRLWTAGLNASWVKSHGLTGDKRLFLDLVA